MITARPQLRRARVLGGKRMLSGDIHITRAGILRRYLTRIESAATRLHVNTGNTESPELLYESCDRDVFIPDGVSACQSKVDQQLRCRRRQTELCVFEPWCTLESDSEVTRRKEDRGNKGLRLIARVPYQNPPSNRGELRLHLKIGTPGSHGAREVPLGKGC